MIASYADPAHYSFLPLRHPFIDILKGSQQEACDFYSMATNWVPSQIWEGGIMAINLVLKDHWGASP